MHSMKSVAALCILLVAKVASFGTVCQLAFGTRSCGLSMSAVAEAPTDSAQEISVENLRYAEESISCISRPIEFRMCESY
jgi:hypothetical protein